MTTFRLLGLLLLSCLNLLLAGHIQSQVNSNAPQSSPAADYSKEPFILESEQTKSRFDADGKGEREFTIRSKIQSESAVKEFGLLAYSYASSFETLDVMYVRVRKPDGSVVETPASDVQDLDSAVSRDAPMYSDQREKHIAVKALAVGDVLEVGVKWVVHNPIAPGHFWFADSYFKMGICLRQTMILDVPRAVAVKVNYTDPKPRIEDKGDRRIYTFETAHLKSAEESKIPDWEKNYYGLDPPDVRLTSFTSWADLGSWLNSLQEEKLAVTPEIRAKAEELTKGHNSDEEKIRAVYDFVATHFRYIGVDLGMGRYAPHAAADILANRYGDCKDKHTLFAALLKAQGLHAYPVLMSSHFRVDSDFPSPDVFDHMITAIPKADSYVFLDTTPEMAPYGLLVPMLRDRQALVMPSGAAAKLVKTPAEPPFRSYQTVAIDSSINEEGTLDATMRIETRGDRELPLRSLFRNTPQNKWDDLTQVLVNSMGFAGKSSEVSVSQPEDTAKPFVISYKYRRTDFPDWKNHQISLPAPFLVLPELTDEQKVSKNPLPLGSAEDVTYTTTVKLPKDYAAEAPANITRKTDFAEFVAEYSFEKKDGTLHGMLHWKTLRREVPGSERDKYTDLAKSISDAQSQYISVNGGVPIPLLVPPNLVALTGSHPEQAVPQLEKIVASQPQNETASRMLATAYMRAGRGKDAVALLEKNVASHPQDLWSVTSLGEAYLKVPDVDKAMEHFKKAIESNPDPMVLNQVAYALGDNKSKLSDAQDYSKQALKQLSEQSMEIDPEDTHRDDFVLMAKLAMNWDTLGWIKFQMGEAEAAEKYVLASWQLVQNPIVGEHLVEIYEKEGRPQKAAPICTMALAAYGNDSVREKLADEMKRLKPYAKTASSSDGSIALSDIRTLHVTFQTKLKDKSRWMHVVIALTAGEKKAQVVYVSGAEELQKANESLAVLKYPQGFPDETPTRVVREAVFSCSVFTTDCTVVLAPALDAAAGN